MIVTWMLYSTAVAALLGASAVLVERVARDRGLPGRWVWSAALATSVLLPPAVFQLSPPEAAAAVELGRARVVASGPAAVPEEASGGDLDLGALALRLEGPARVAWLALSTLLVLLFAGSAARLRLRGRRWRPTRLEGLAVRVSHETGPAVVGLLRPFVVVPSWVLELPAADRALILTHEEEHLRGGDPLLVLAGFALVVACPWNVGLWWQLRRLRAAVEVDCDGRVVGSRPSRERRRYGELLWSVGQRVRAGAHRPALAAFAERSQHLERRIRTMLGLNPILTPRRIVGWSLAAGLLAAGVWLIPSPRRQAPPPAPPEEAVSEVVEVPAPRDVSAAPTFTPYTVAPDITNRTEVQRALEREYPPLLRDAGIGGTVSIWFFIDENGRVQDTRIQESSGHAQLDEAALRVADVMRFAPALNRDAEVPVWVTFPITFQVRGARPTAEPEAEPPPPVEAPRPVERQASGSGFTPYTRAPRIQNPAEIQQALEEAYPPLLRDAGIGGTVSIWLYVNTDGRVEDTRVAVSSGRPELDRAALGIADVFRFSPGANGDEPVGVWLSYPVTFEVR